MPFGGVTRGTWPKSQHGSKGAGSGPKQGPGFFGPAKGAGKSGAGPGRPKGVGDGEGKSARARAMLLEAGPDAAKALIDIATNEQDERRLQAAVHILNRIGLHEKSGIELSGQDGGPIAISRVIVDPGAPKPA